MTTQSNNIVQILTPELHNIIGKMVEIDEDRGAIVLKNARMIVMSSTQQNAVMFVPLSPFMPSVKDLEIPLRMIAYEDAQKQLESGYLQATSGIIMPSADGGQTGAQRHRSTPVSPLIL